ncbi:hypothetical protein EON68_05105 [archaeon]|nr:MAG: hypothetical protein EON68_05105 [archaeon]
MLPQYVPVTSRGATLAGASSSSSSSSSSSVVGGGRNAVASPRGSAFAAERAPWGELALPAGHTPRGGSAYMPRSLSSPRSGGVGGAGSGFGVGAVSGAMSGVGIPSVATVAGSIQTERARRMAAENEVRELQRALAATQIQAP